MAHVQPLHQFRVSVAQRLQKAPFNWVGGAAYQLTEKYSALVEQCWNEYEFADATAGLIHNTYMSRPVKPVALPTMASMAAVGCTFHKA